MFECTYFITLFASYNHVLEPPYYLVARHGAHGSSHHLSGEVAIGRRRAPKHQRLAQRCFAFWIEFLGVQKKVRVSGNLVGHLEVGAEDRFVEHATAGRGENVLPGCSEKRQRQAPVISGFVAFTKRCS